MRDEHDPFWKELMNMAHAKPAPDLTMEEAEARMRTGGEIPFTDAELDNIVTSVTGEVGRSDHKEDDTDAFWQNLLARVDQSTVSPDLTMEEAEERMQSAGEDPLSEQQIDSIVQSATAEEARRGLRVLEPEPVPERRNFFVRHTSALTKVAALFLGMLLLYSVTSRTFEGLEPRDSWTYGTEMGLLMDPQAEIGTRVSAQVRVRNFARAGIRALKNVVVEGGELRTDAERHLDDLRQALDSADSLSTYEVHQPIESLADLIRDTDEPLPQRRAWLRTLMDQTRNAILAVKTAETDAQESDLNIGRRRALGTLARELDS